MKKAFVIFIALLSLAACGQGSPDLKQAQQTAQALAPTLQSGAQSAQQTAEALMPTLQSGAQSVQQTAVALATQNPVDIQSVQQTAKALVPTVQARAPEIEATVEALATLVPKEGMPALATLQALTKPGTIPDDIPIAEPANIVLNTQRRIMYTTTLSPAEVVRLYLGEMEDRGWRMQPDAATTESGGRLGFEKPSRTVTVTIVRTGEATTVDLALGEK